MINSNLILIENVSQQYITPQVNNLFLFAMFTVYSLSTKFISSNTTWISWVKIICPSAVISKVIYNFAFSAHLLVSQELYSAVGELLMLRVLACFSVLVLSLFASMLMQFTRFAKYISNIRYYKFCTILFLNFLGIPYLELSLLCSAFFASLSTHNYLKFLQACNTICKSLQNRFVLFAGIGAIVTIYALSEEAFAASRTSQTGASAVPRVVPVIRKCLEGNDPEDVIEFTQSGIRYTLKKLGWYEDPNAVSRGPKLKTYDPTVFTCKNERNAPATQILQKLTAEKTSNMKSCHARLLNRVNSGGLKGTYQPTYYKGVNLWSSRVYTREGFFEAETKANYRSVEASASEIRNKLSTKQLNGVFLQEVKEKYVRKTTLADQTCLNLTTDQVNKTFSHKRIK